MNDETEFDRNQLQSKQDFGRFLEWFADDFKHNSAQWKNVDLPSFLEALIAYTDDIAGYYRNMQIQVDVEKPSWRLFADLLCGARVYE
jgi:hypothetical protein